MKSARWCPDHGCVLEELWDGAACTKGGHWATRWYVVDLAEPVESDRWKIAETQIGKSCEFACWYEERCEQLLRELAIEDWTPPGGFVSKPLSKFYANVASKTDALPDSRSTRSARWKARKRAEKLGIPVPEWAKQIGKTPQPPNNRLEAAT